jgi:hypothetical protein
MNLKTTALFALTTTILSGCLESEKSCYERLASDFKSSIEFGMGSSCTGDRLGCLDYAGMAPEAKARIASIYWDDDQSACDYISDGPSLKRK